MMTSRHAIALWLSALSMALPSCSEDPASHSADQVAAGADATSGAGATSGIGTTGGVGAAGGVAGSGGAGTSGATGDSGASGGVAGVGAASGGVGGVSATGGVGAAGGSGGAAGVGGSSGANTFKPRVIHTTDLGADPDDEMSMVRALLMANWMDIEGLVVATGCWRKSQSNTDMLDDLVDAYGQVVSNLQAHDPEYPSVEYLRSISVMGQRGYGMDDVGAGKDSPGSELIIAAVDSDDPRPVWTTCWGGCNTTAQALWKVQNSRTPAELEEFVSRLRVYDVLGQDDAGTWIAKTFPDLLYIRATKVYSWQPSDSWVDQNVQSHGVLGAAYPEAPYAYEGDSPAIFHLIPNGLNDPDEVDHGGWGGSFPSERKSAVRGMSCMSGEDAPYDPYYMFNEDSESISRWKSALQNDFEARMDWSISANYADANHHPIAVVNGDTGRSYLRLTAAAGTSVELTAATSSDPDGDGLTYSWKVLDEPSVGSASVQSPSAEATTVSVSTAGEIHIVLEVVDTGAPNLTAYRRVLINAAP